MAKRDRNDERELNLRRKLHLVALAGVLAAALLLPALSRATPPGSDGRIVYMGKDRAGHWQVWVASSGMSGAKQLTHGRHGSGWAVWSPNGRKLAFDKLSDVFVMNADGSHVRKLTDSKGASGDAAWSPNRSLIAFDADRGNRKGFRAIYLMNPKGGKLQRVTRPRPPLSDYSPRFSPDGTHLVFLRARGTAVSAPAALYTVRLDGRDLHRLTSFGMHVDQPDWSPGGSRIVFQAHPNPAAYPDIYVINAAGGRPVNLTNNPTGQAGSADPVWAPNGRKILFRDNRYLNGTGRTGLATMNPDGSRRHFISSKNIEARQPDWESVHP